MAKKTPKQKEPVRIRFKELANGDQSIYLDVYNNGKRQYEFLKLYLIKEQTPFDKLQNAETLNAANAIKAQRVIELANGKAGIKQSGKGKMLLADWVETCNGGASAPSTKRIYNAVTLHLKNFAPANMKLADVDAAFCVSFIDYLQNVHKKRNGVAMTARTTALYFSVLSAMLNKAVRKGLISKNPTAELEDSDKVVVKSTPRAYLEIDEVKALIKTECGLESVKRAFLFSCFCGLRLSDVSNLTWGDLKTDGNKINAISIKKTGALLYLPLSDSALKWLPDKRGAAAASVFELPKSQAWTNTLIGKWAAAAGITKHVTFHTSRHTFATMMLTLGADLYTTSKLLGHADISTTQIYAEIVNQKKIEAVNLTNGIFKEVE